MKVYIAGKMRGLPEYGFPLFDRAQEYLESFGMIVVSPAEMDREIGFDPTSDEPVTAEFIHDAMRRDIRKITECDAIAMLPNWKESGGARCELDVAARIGLKVFFIGAGFNSLRSEEPANV